MNFEKELKPMTTNIPGLIVFDLPVHGDNRGWFKENWQRQKMMALGLPDFGPVQNNISFNTKRGTTRGIHAEPWDKYISIANGKIFGAWVDLRPGDTFGEVFTCELDPSKAIFVPRGVGNSFQTLEDETVYTYLVNAHWSADQKKNYTFVNLADPTLNIQWPIALSEAELSQADANHPMLAEAKTMKPKRTMVLGANGQLGHAITAWAQAHHAEEFEFHDADTFDITNPQSYADIDWSLYGTIINAAAYTAVDKAERREELVAAWKTNVEGVRLLAKVATEHNITLVHISSDYVFDGEREYHREDEPFAPLNVYGQTKAAGDAIVANVPRHYIVRSSWVVGDGANFAKRIVNLAKEHQANPNAIQSAPNNQFGRLTFTDTITDGIFYLLNNNVPYGTYNLTNSGPVASWYDLAQVILAQCECEPAAIEETTVEAWAEKTDGATRPHHCELHLEKIRAAGFNPPSWEEKLRNYVASLLH